MKTVIMGLVLAVMFAGSAFAQFAGSGERCRTTCTTHSWDGSTTCDTVC